MTEEEKLSRAKEKLTVIFNRKAQEQFIHQQRQMMVNKSLGAKGGGEGQVSVC